MKLIDITTNFKTHPLRYVDDLVWSHVIDQVKFPVWLYIWNLVFDPINLQDSVRHLIEATLAINQHETKKH